MLSVWTGKAKRQTRTISQPRRVNRRENDGAETYSIMLREVRTSDR